MSKDKKQGVVKPHGTIQSVNRALTILESFTIQRPEIGVSDLARSLDLNKSTVFGLITTLEKRGYLEKNKQNDKYHLGIRVIELGESRLTGIGFQKTT